jgi:putative endonuclease
MQKQPAVYLLANKPYGTLYVGVTGDLAKRVWEHKNKVVKGFTEKYNLTKLVYFEFYDDMVQAITREKQFKAGSRSTKIELIRSSNPEWEDLYQHICR